MSAPVGVLGQRHRSPVDAHRQRTADDDGASHTARGRFAQQTQRPGDVDPTHLGLQRRPTSNADLECQVQQRFHAAAGGTHCARIIERAVAPYDVEAIEDIGYAVAQFEDTRTHARSVETLDDVVAEERARSGHQDSVHEVPSNNTAAAREADSTPSAAWLPSMK
jgi:hypothetical protein